jgi:hypothetical protein
LIITVASASLLQAYSSFDRAHYVHIADILFQWHSQNILMLENNETIKDIQLSPNLNQQMLTGIDWNKS